MDCIHQHLPQRTFVGHKGQINIADRFPFLMLFYNLRQSLNILQTNTFHVLGTTTVYARFVVGRLAHTVKWRYRPIFRQSRYHVVMRIQYEYRPFGMSALYMDDEYRRMIGCFGQTPGLSERYELGNIVFQPRDASLVFTIRSGTTDSSKG